MSRGWPLVTTTPCELMEIPYPWDSLGIFARMPLWNALNGWVFKCVNPPIRFHRADTMYPHGFLRALEDQGIQLASFTYDEIIGRLSKPCAEEEMAEFLTRLIDDLGVCVQGKITVSEPKWVTEYREYHVAVRGGTEVIPFEYWEVEVDQYGWIRSHVPPLPPVESHGLYFRDRVSIDRDKGRMLVYTTGYSARRVSLWQVWSEYIGLDLDIPMDRVAALQAQLEEYRMALAREEDLEAKFRLAIQTQEDDASIRRRQEIWHESMEQRFDARRTYDKLQRDPGLDECTERDKQRITKFVEIYGFPFIPFEPDSYEEYGEYYFNAFKKYYRQFMAIYEKMEQRKQYNGDDFLTVSGWIRSGLALDLSTGEVKDPETDTEATYFNINKKASFVSLAQVLAQSDRRLREEGFGDLYQPYTECAYCKSPIRKQPLTKYARFAHCSDKACRSQAKNDIKRWRLENEPGYQEKLREQARERQTRRRSKLKEQQIT